MVRFKYILSSGEVIDLKEESGELTEVKDIYRARFFLASELFTWCQEDPGAKCELWEHGRCIESYSSRDIAKKNVAIMNELSHAYNMSTEKKIDWLKTRWFEV